MNFSVGFHNSLPRRFHTFQLLVKVHPAYEIILNHFALYPDHVFCCFLYLLPFLDFLSLQVSLQLSVFPFARSTAVNQDGAFLRFSFEIQLMVRFDWSCCQCRSQCQQRGHAWRFQSARNKHVLPNVLPSA